MNRTKFLSSLLVGALFLASTSVFVSCKDYDDDIKNLQEQIDKSALKTTIEALQSQLNSIASNAEAAQKKAEEALAAANSAVTAEQLAAVKAIAEQAGTDAANAIKAATSATNDANTAAEAAKKAQEAADKAVAMATDGSKALEEIGKLSQTYVTTTALQAQLEALKAELSSGGEVSPGQVANYDAVISELYQAVTSVSLYVSSTANDKKYDTNAHGTQAVVFPYAIEKGTIFPHDANIATEQYTFTKDRYATLPYELKIRVSPTNAQLTADMISLINSQGEEIDKSLVEVVELEPYDEELMTRSMTSKSGIWTVTFKLKDGYNPDEFKATVEKDNRNVVFAVAINNTPQSPSTRRIVSEYDLTVDAGEAVPAYEFDVDETPVAQIHNRWSFCEGDRTATNSSWSGVEKDNVVELNWKKSTSQYPTPAIYEEISEENTGDRINGLNGNDNRQYQGIHAVVKDEEVLIEFPNMSNFEAIRAFYVTLDAEFAKESKPSEINAWNSYEYENVGYTNTKGEWIPATLQYGNKGYIKIKDINNVKGDIIGFRVYAVNLDGTLYDPDGRAFYVKIGDPVGTKTLEPIEVVVTDDVEKSISEEYDCTGLLSEDVTDYQLFWSSNNTYVLRSSALVLPVEDEKTQYERQNGNTFTSSDVTRNFNIEFFNPESEEWETISQILSANVAADVTKLRVQILNPAELLDDATYHLVMKGYSQSWTGGSSIIEPIDLIKIDVKKTLINELPEGLAKKQGQLPDNLLTVYMKPKNNMATPWVTDWDVNNIDYVNYGEDVRPYDLADIFNNVQLSVMTNTGWVKTYYGFDFMNSDLKNETKEIATHSGKDNSIGGFVKSDVYGPFSIIANSYAVPYANAKFVNGEEHDVYATYEYRNISLTKTKTGASTNWQPVQEAYTVRGENPLFKVKYISSLDLERIVPWYKVVNGLDHRPDLYMKYGVSATEAYKLDLNNATTAQKELAKKIRDKHYDNNYVVTYERGGNVHLDSLRYDQIYIPGLSAATVLEKTGIEGDKTESLDQMIYYNYLKVIDVEIIDANGNACDYLETDIAHIAPDKKTIKLVPTRSTSAPALFNNMNYILKITVMDVFGHERVINIDFTMLKPNEI